MTPTQTAHRSQRLLFALLSLAAGSALALVLAEGFVRLFFPHARDHAITRNVLALDGYLGWKLASSSSATHATRYFTADYRINSLGFRDRQRITEKPPGIHRVLVFGDSHIFGWGVASRQRFTNIVESNRTGWEVWNLAVPGYGLDQQILFYEQAGERFCADEVVFFVSKAILRRSRTNYIYAKYKPLLEPDSAGGLKLAFLPQGRVSWMSALRAVLSPLALPYFLEAQLNQLMAVIRPSSDEWRPRQECLSELEKRLFLRASKLAARRSQKMKLLLNLSPPFQNEVRAFSTQNGIDCLLVEVDITQPGVIFAADDPHWTPATHHRMARHLLAHWD